jgi:thiol-disulfide isomerase/thioredoxin
MGINLKEKFQNLNKKKVSIILLLLIILMVCGVGAYQYINNKHRQAEAEKLQKIEQQAKELYKQQRAQENPEQAQEPKKPSDYAVGEDYNKAMSGKKPVLVLFYADWCGYCIRFMPIYEKISKKYGKDLVLAKVNVEDPNYAQLVRDMGIMGFPTVFMLDPKYDNQVLIGNNHLGSVEDLSVEVDRFMRIRRLLDKK